MLLVSGESLLCKRAAWTSWETSAFVFLRRITSYRLWMVGLVSMSSERGFIGARSRRLLLQKSDALFQHPHLRLVPLHHRHHLRLQLLQLVLVLLLGFLVRRHQITAAHKHSTATETSSTRTDLTSITNTALAAKYQLQLDGNMNNILDMGVKPLLKMYSNLKKRNSKIIYILYIWTLILEKNTKITKR